MLECNFLLAVSIHPTGRVTVKGKQGSPLVVRQPSAPFCFETVIASFIGVSTGRMMLMDRQKPSISVDTTVLP